MTPKGSKITVLTWFKNEEHILPFFLRHYRFADQIIAWDNQSTDSSRAIMAADPRVTVNEWDSGGELRDDQLIRMKNEEYLKTGPGWNIIVDADEFVYHPEILTVFDLFDEKGITLATTMGFDMISIQLPADDGVSLLTDLVKEGCRTYMYDKPCVIRESCRVTYNYGAHTAARFEGRTVTTDKPYLKLLHYRFLSLALVMEKARRIKLSDQNRKIQVGGQQSSPEQMRRRWEETWKRRIRVFP